MMWLAEDCVDELDVAIAHRDFDAALSLLAKAQDVQLRFPQQSGRHAVI